jgi:hypothetical protein
MAHNYKHRHLAFHQAPSHYLWTGSEKLLSAAKEKLYFQKQILGKADYHNSPPTAFESSVMDRHSPGKYAAACSSTAQLWTRRRSREQLRMPQSKGK